MGIRNKEAGFIEELLAFVLILVVLWFMFWFLPSIKFKGSEELVSGIVYNNTNSAWLSGNTNFSVRADVNTYVSEENKSSYCLPPHSPYIALVNEAARDKRIKVIVTEKKTFQVVSAPWVCVDNVTVERAK